MIKNVVNPWKWQDQFGFVQANDVRESQKTLFCAGQVSVNSEGNLLHAGDMVAQIKQVLDNLETVIHQAGYQVSDIVRLNYYTTDVQAFSEAAYVLGERLGQVGCQPASTLLGVAALFHPDCLVEMEATVVT